MIEVRCSNCEQVFEAEDSAAGRSEFCPACGTLNDVPAPDPDEEELVEQWDAPPPSSTATATPVAPPRGGASPVLWWMLELAALAIIVWIGWLLFSGSWENRHLQFLSDTITRADGMMSGGDLDGARREYARVLDTVGNRTLESLYLRDVVARAHRGIQTVQLRQRTAMAASQRSASSEPTTVPDLNAAIKSFQRASGGFADFVRQRPMLLQDSHGSWRRRQFVVWGVNYEIQSDVDPPRITLEYTCNPRLTAAHADRQDALADTQFTIDERTAPITRKTTFVLRDGQWVAVHEAPQLPEDNPSVIRDGSLRPDDPSILGGLGVLELQAFSSP
jgi:hypothetical protein